MHRIIKKENSGARRKEKGHFVFSEDTTYKVKKKTIMKKVVVTSENNAADREAVAIIRTGNELAKEKAFTKLYNRYFDHLVFHIMKFVNMNKEVSEDLAQETMSKAFVNIGQYDDTYAFSTWLFNIAKNLIIDKKRQGKVEVLSFEDLKAGNDGEEDTAERLFELADTSVGANAEEIIARENRQTELYLVIVSIKNEKHKAVLIACELEEKSYKEVSDELNLPVGTVKALLFRAKEEIKNFLAERKFDARVYQGLSSKDVKRKRTLSEYQKIEKTIIKSYKTESVAAVKALRAESEMVMA